MPPRSRRFVSAESGHVLSWRMPPGAAETGDPLRHRYPGRAPNSGIHIALGPDAVFAHVGNALTTQAVGPSSSGSRGRARGVETRPALVHGVELRGGRLTAVRIDHYQLARRSSVRLRAFSCGNKAGSSRPAPWCIRHWRGRARWWVPLLRRRPSQPAFPAGSRCSPAPSTHSPTPIALAANSPAIRWSCTGRRSSSSSSRTTRI